MTGQSYDSFDKLLRPSASTSKRWADFVFDVRQVPMMADAIEAGVKSKLGRGSGQSLPPLVRHLFEVIASRPPVSRMINREHQQG